MVISAFYLASSLAVVNNGYIKAKVRVFSCKQPLHFYDGGFFCEYTIMKDHYLNIAISSRFKTLPASIERQFGVDPTRFVVFSSDCMFHQVADDGFS